MTCVWIEVPAELAAPNGEFYQIAKFSRSYSYDALSWSIDFYMNKLGWEKTMVLGTH